MVIDVEDIKKHLQMMMIIQFSKIKNIILVRNKE